MLSLFQNVSWLDEFITVDSILQDRMFWQNAQAATVQGLTRAQPKLHGSV